MPEIPDVSIVIPCYNEEKNLARGVLDEVDRYLQAQDYKWEALVVNDESTDGSRARIEDHVKGRPRWSLVDIPHGGKPAAVWAGIQAARGEWVLFTDMDQSTPIDELSNLLPWTAQGCDVVIGSRGTAREGNSLLRKLGSLIFLTARRWVLLRDIRDTQCGFKLCRRAAALRVFPRLQFFQQKDGPRGWKVSAFDVELLHLFERAGYRIHEVVVQWRNRDVSDTKSQQGELSRYVRESLEMVREVVRVKRNEMRGLYDDV